MKNRNCSPCTYQAHGVRSHCRVTWPSGRRRPTSPRSSWAPAQRSSLRWPSGKGLVINYGEGGGGMGKPQVPKLFAPPPSRQGKIFRAPLFKEWKLFAPPPPSIWLKLQATAWKLPQNFLWPPLRMAKTFSTPPPPLFVWVKLNMPSTPIL